MPYILEKLLNVRQHRENRALNQLVRRKADLVRRESEKHQKERQLSDFRQWRKARESSLFDRLQSEPASVQDLMRFTDAVSSMRQDQSAKVQQVSEAAERLSQAENEHQAARQSHAMASRQKTKIEEHKNVWMNHASIEAQRHAENEIEELGQPIPLSI